jgi:hypothetical protein
MKSGSLGSYRSQNEISLKHMRSFSLGDKEEEIKKGDLYSSIKEEVVNSEVEAEQIEIPQYEEEPKVKKEDTESIFSKERRNRKFTREEDEKLKALVKIYGEGAWSRIAKEMEGRNRKQVRERYVNFLKKEKVTTEFTPEEDVMILQYVQAEGRKWSAIAEKLTGKTPIMIKNRYYAKLRRTAKETKQRSEQSVTSSRADSSTGEQITPSNRQIKQNGTAQKAGIEEDSWTRLRKQEEYMKSALADLRRRIERTKKK